MKSVRVSIPRPGAVVLQDVDVPDPGAEEVTVRVACCGICGSDLHTYRRGHPWLPYPIFPGHEIAGVVTAAGQGVTHIAPGDEVLINPVVSCSKCRYCRQGRTNLCRSLVGVGSHIPGGMADFITIPSRTAMPIPDGISLRAAALVEPAATVARALARVGPIDDRLIVVLGAGTIGLLTVGMSVAGGAERVVVTDLRAEKRQRAMAWGASAAVDAGGSDVLGGLVEASGDAPDVVFDCVGRPSTFQLSMELVAKGGTVVIVGADHGDASASLQTIQDGEVTITGVAMYTRDDFAAAASYVESNTELVTSLVTAEFPISRANEAFELADSGDAVKVHLIGDEVRPVPTRSPANELYRNPKAVPGRHVAGF
jgi:L-iditol 2-dehydrogenase